MGISGVALHKKLTIKSEGQRVEQLQFFWQPCLETLTNSARRRWVPLLQASEMTLNSEKQKSLPSSTWQGKEMLVALSRSEPRSQGWSADPGPL